MTPDDIRYRGTQICRRLSVAVDRVAPEGIGHWPRAWEIVEAPDVDFLLALARWEHGPNVDTAADVKVTYNAVLEAWKQAIREYESAGTHEPTASQETTPVHRSTENDRTSRLRSSRRRAG